MRLDEYAAHDGLGLAALVRAREVKPAELVELAVEAASQLKPTLGAVVATYPDRIETAAEVPGSPFAGVPTMVKDLFHGEPGWECGNGSRLCSGWKVTYPDEYTTRLRAGGLIPMGRSATSEFGLLGTTETLAEGRTCTPWDTSTMAGGSSGGAGRRGGRRDRAAGRRERRRRQHPHPGLGLRSGGAQAEPRAGPLGSLDRRAAARLGRALRDHALGA